MPREDTQFKPGQSGNPAGKKPGTFSVKRLIEKTAEKLGPERFMAWVEQNEDVFWEKIATKTIEREMKHSGDGENPIKHDHVFRAPDMSIEEWAKIASGHRKPDPKH